MVGKNKVLHMFLSISMYRLENRLGEGEKVLLIKMMNEDTFGEYEII